MSDLIQTPAISAPPKMQSKRTFYINFFDGINEEKVKALMGIVTELMARQKPDCLYFLISSPGGSVTAGIVFYNFLRSLPVEIVMHNTGSVDSIGTIIFLAGERRYASVHSSFLFHGVVFKVKADTRISHAQMTEKLSQMRQDETKIAGIVASRTALTSQDIKQLFHQGESKDAAFAKEKGIVEEIKDPIIPQNAPLITVNLN